jgi:hypothetical protein
MPAANIATVERVDAARADRLDDHARIDVIGVPARRLDGVIGTGRVGLPKLDSRTDGAVENRIAAAATG